MSVVRIFGVAAALTLVAGVASGQEVARERVGYIVAVVGDSAILNYDIQEDEFRMRAQGGNMPTSGPALDQLRAQILETRIDNLVVLQAAQRDTTIVIDDAAIRQSVQREIQRREQQLGGPAAMQEALARNGLTLAEFQSSLEQQIRRDQMIQQYIQRSRRDRQPPPVTEDEMRAFLEAQLPALGERPATVIFEQLVVPVSASDSAVQRARLLSDSIFDLIQQGGDFEQLARRFSQDPGSRERGGDLGWFREGDMVREFSRASFSMRPGMISPPIRTSFGFHIIKLERVRGAERQARHILIQPEKTPADETRARALADSLATEIRAGADLTALAERHGDPEEQRRIGPLVYDQLPEPYGAALRGAANGTVVGPLQLGGEGAPVKFSVVRVIDLNESGDYSLDDPIVRQRIREQLEEQKLLDEIVSELRRRTYIDIRGS